MPKYDREQAVAHFPNLIRDSKRGKFKLCIGMTAGVGKSYRMFQEVHSLIKNGIDVRIDFMNINTVCMGKSTSSRLNIILAISIFNALLKQLAKNDTDLIIMS